MGSLGDIGAAEHAGEVSLIVDPGPDIAEADLRAQLDARLGVVQFDNGEMLYPRNGETHRVHLNISEDVGVTLLRQLPLPDPPDTGADQ